MSDKLFAAQSSVSRLDRPCSASRNIFSLLIVTGHHRAAPGILPFPGVCKNKKLGQGNIQNLFLLKLYKSAQDR